MATKNKYLDKTLSQLKAIAVTHFHKYIRNRDRGKPCISCGRHTTLQAGHYYSAGQHPSVRFDPDNVHGQCLQCNYFKHGNLINYSHNIIDRIGEKRFNNLKLKIDLSKRARFKWSKFYLIDVIEKYKELNKKPPSYEQE
tara:strand:+ start:1288 stop:1707 length:420 start_codon:yes stop_codon:yes gene_type:complete